MKRNLNGKTPREESLILSKFLQQSTFSGEKHIKKLLHNITGHLRSILVIC